MRQKRDRCSKSKVEPFWRWLADFLFSIAQYFLDLITDSLGVLSATVRGGAADALFVGGGECKAYAKSGAREVLGSILIPLIRKLQY